MGRGTERAAFVRAALVATRQTLPREGALRAPQGAPLRNGLK